MFIVKTLASGQAAVQAKIELAAIRAANQFPLKREVRCAGCPAKHTTVGGLLLEDGRFYGPKCRKVVEMRLARAAKKAA